MARMLGDRFLPDSVSAARRSLRERAMDLREPIRSRRQSLVPGPDVIGKTETKISDLRDSFMSRDGVLARMRERNSGSGEEDTSSGDKKSGDSGTRREEMN